MCPRFDDLTVYQEVLAESRISLWCFEQEAGAASRLYADATFDALSGITDKLTPEERFVFWAQRIDPEYRPMVDEALEKVSCSHVMQLQYPWHHPTKGRVYISCGGIRDAGFRKGVRIRGFHQELTYSSWHQMQAEAEIRRLRELHKHSLERDMLLETISKQNLSEYFIDVENDSYYAFKVAEGWKHRSPGTGSWDELARVYIREHIDKEYQEGSLDRFTTEALKRRLSPQKPEFSYETPVHWLEGDRWFRNDVYYVSSNDKGELKHVVFTMRDVTEDVLARQAAERELKEQMSIISVLSRDFLNVLLVDPAENHVAVLKMDGYLAIGVDWDHLDEYAYDELCERYISARVHPDEQDMMRAALSMDNVLEHLSQKEEYSINYRTFVDGETHYFQFRVARLEDRDKIIAAFRNIDDLVAAEKQQKEALQVALAAAEHANRAKTTFLNNMSHDIRTPMNAIIGFTALAASHIGQPELVRDYLSKIAISSNHLLSLINDVLDMSRIESGNVKIEQTDVHLPDVLHDLRTIVQPNITAKQQELFIDTQDVTTEDIITDRLRLNQVLINILSNAIKFTPAGGTISLRVCELPCQAPGHATFAFHIKDNGIGMSQDFQQHIFEAFMREETSTVSRIQGTGLGLAITKNIVDMMGGTITVSSEVGKGSEFVVTLTCKTGAAEPPRELPHELQGARALVVDDDLNTCTGVTKMLTQIGMRADWTTSGKEAVFRSKFAVEQGDAFSAYIIDWMLPDMNGLEVVRRVRHAIGQETPIIILTAYDWSDIEQEAREAGVTAFCAKPLFLSDLRDVLCKPQAAPAPAPEAPRKSFAGKRILLAEDNELNREIAIDILRDEGFEVDAAEDGAVAVDMLSAAPAGYYDLILMDIQMPRMNGYDTTRRIRAMEDLRKASIPIIAMTANAFTEDVAAAKAAGMNAHLAKPVDIDRMREMLGRYL